MENSIEKHEEINNIQNNNTQNNDSHDISIHNNNNTNNENQDPHQDDFNSPLHVPFQYFDKTDDSFVFKLNIEEMENFFKKLKGKYKCAICILLNDDSTLSSTYLYATLKGIIDNESCLNNLNISFNDIIIFTFINKIKNNSLIEEEEKLKFEFKDQFLLINKKLTKHQNLNVCLICKNTYLYTIESLKCYYNFIIPIIRFPKQMIYSIILTAGVMPQKDSFETLMKYAYNNVKTHGISVAPVEITPDFLVSKIYQFDRVFFNIYNMSVYNATASVPICSLFSVFSINDDIQKFLNDYYLNAYNNMSIDYHDYNLSLFLHNRKIPIKFYYNEPLGIIPYKNMEYCQYQRDWVNRNTGYYGNFFDILKTFINSKNPIIEKFFMIFQLISIAIEFIYPSLATMVIYTILYEGFGTYDYRPAIFYTSFYLIMMTASGFCSLVSKDPYQMKLTNYILYIIMEIFYLFIILTSVVAMDNVKKNKKNDKYIFSNAATGFIIAFTFVPYIIPMFMKKNSIFKNILPMFLYLLLGASCSTTNFYMAKIFNAPDVSGGKNIIFRKGVYIIIYVLFNLFFGILSLYNTNRTKRVKSVMVLGIMFLIYNFFKIVGIIVKLSIKDDKYFNDPKILENIQFDLRAGSSIEELETSDDFKKKNANLEGDNNGQHQANYEEEKLDEEENNHSSSRSESISGVKNVKNEDNELDDKDVEVEF